MAEAPAAPLEKAVERVRDVLDWFDRRLHPPLNATEREAVPAMRELLAALDADPWWSVWQKTYLSQRAAEDRLEKAEAALREIADTECDTEQAALVAGREDTRTCAEKAPEHQDIWCGFCIARRYFAEKGERP